MKKRDFYMNQMIAFKDKPLIKVVTGIRRCGKSTLLSLFEAHLLECGICKENILRMNFESFEFDEITDYKSLYRHIKDRLSSSGRTYVLLDEVQLVDSWEKAINALMVDADVDLYITGSNAYLLSSELSTLLSGRYVEIKVYPLSFKEYMGFIGADGSKENAAAQNIGQAFSTYMKYGGLPTIVDLMDMEETIGPFLEGIYNTVLMKDVIERNSIRDAALLEAILKFLASNVGCVVSTKKISDYLTSSGRKVTSDTIDNYLSMLEKAFIIYKANRYDLKGKMYLKTLEKYYMVDMGIRNQLTGFKNTDYGHVLENIVFMELKRRGYDVSIGRIGPLEVDFVATKKEEKAYYQVSASIMDEETRHRELRSLQAISDNYPKWLVTMDPVVYSDYEGIRVINVIDFLNG